MKVEMEKREMMMGGGDSATHTLNQTRDNNTDFKSYYNYTINHNCMLQ